MDPHTIKPWRGWAIALATLSSLSGLVLGPALLFATGRSSFIVADAMRDGGVPLVAGLLAGLVLAALVPLAAIRRIPSAIVVALVLLPWLVGSFSALVPLARMSHALELADPSSRATMVARSVSGYMHAHWVGASISMGLAMGVLGGFAWGSLAATGERRLLAGAGIGLGLGLASTLLVPLPALAASVLRLDTASLTMTWVVGATSLGPMILAGMGASHDDPRSHELAVSAALMGSILVACTAPIVSAVGSMMAFSAVANAQPSDRAALLLQGAAECRMAFGLTTLAFVLSLLVPAVAVLRAQRSTTLTRGSYVGGAVALGLVVAMIVVHVASTQLALAFVGTIDGMPFADMLTP